VVEKLGVAGVRLSFPHSSAINGSKLALRELRQSQVPAHFGSSMHLTLAETRFSCSVATSPAMRSSTGE
jgi:hypothetical protein